MNSKNELWETSEFFARRLFAKGKLSVTGVVVAGRNLRRPAVREVLRWFAGIGLDQTDAIICADPQNRDEEATLADWMMGEDFSLGVFDNMDWRYAPGWRNRYKKAPHPGEKPVNLKSLVTKRGKTTFGVEGAPSWFVSGTSTHALNVAAGNHPFGRGLGRGDKTCGDCGHLCGPIEGRFFKCGLEKANWSHGPGTDLRKKWRACGSFKDQP